MACCVFVLHHLDDEALRRGLAELARVVRGELVVMDPLWLDRRAISRLLWRYDDGAHPRTRERLLAALLHVPGARGLLGRRDPYR